MKIIRRWKWGKLGKLFIVVGMEGDEGNLANLGDCLVDLEVVVADD